MLTNIQRLSLQVMTLNPKCEHVQSSHGVPVTVTGVVHCKIMQTPEFLPLAAEQFLGKTVDQIKSVVLRTVEGHMRAVIGTQTIEDISKKRQDLANMIRDVTSQDLSRMGIDIMSFTIKEVKDDVEYLSSLGKQSTAVVKRKAAVSAAKAESDAAQVEAECERDKQELEIKIKTSLAKLEHEMEMAKASQNEMVGKLKAEAKRAYDLQVACMQKEIKKKEMKIKEIEFDNLILIQSKENERRTIELEMDIQLPADAQIYEMKKQTEAYKERIQQEIEAEECRIREEGTAKADAMKLEGEAEAEGLKKIAEARKQFNEAAVLHEVLRVLPNIAAELANPLTKFEEIVLISDGLIKTDSDTAIHDKEKTSNSKSVASAAKLASSVPLAVKAVGGNAHMGRSILNSIMRLDKLPVSR